MRLRPLSLREILCVLRELGYKEIRHAGGHKIFGNGTKMIPVPWHPNRELDMKIVSRIIREFGISREAFLKLLELC